MTPLEQITRRCSFCQQVKTAEYYYRHSKAPDGLQSRCKTCMLKRSKEDYAKNPEAHKLKVRKWRAANPERARINGHAHRLRSQYGIEPADYDRMLEAQGGGCAICQSVVVGRKRTFFCVDHDHETGRVRGLLCMNCNDGLGRFRDDPSMLLSAVAYLGGDY